MKQEIDAAELYQALAFLVGRDKLQYSDLARAHALYTAYDTALLGCHRHLAIAVKLKE